MRNVWIGDPFRFPFQCVSICRELYRLTPPIVSISKYIQMGNIRRWAGAIYNSRENEKRAKSKSEEVEQNSNIGCVLRKNGPDFAHTILHNIYYYYFNVCDFAWPKRVKSEMTSNEYGKGLCNGNIEQSFAVDNGRWGHLRLSLLLSIFTRGVPIPLTHVDLELMMLMPIANGYARKHSRRYRSKKRTIHLILISSYIYL